jgi:hypothetical protein
MIISSQIERGKRGRGRAGSACRSSNSGDYLSESARPSASPSLRRSTPAMVGPRSMRRVGRLPLRAPRRRILAPEAMKVFKYLEGR